MSDILCRLPILGSLFRPIFYPVSVEIYEKIGNTIVKKNDYGRRIRRKNSIEEFKLFKEKINIEPPKFEEYMITKNGKPLLMLLKATSGEFRTFTPMETETIKDDGSVEKGIKVRVTDKNVLSWMVNEYTRNWLRFHKPKWYEVYAPYVILAVSGVIMLVMIVTVSKELTVMSNQLGGVAAQIKAAADTFSQSLSTVGGTVQKPPI